MNRNIDIEINDSVLFLIILKHKGLLSSRKTGTKNKLIVVRSVLRSVEMPADDIYERVRYNMMTCVTSKDLSDAYCIMSSQCS